MRELFFRLRAALALKRPSAAVTGIQKVKTTKLSGPRGYDACKKVDGCRCHAMVAAEALFYAASAMPLVHRLVRAA